MSENADRYFFDVTISEDMVIGHIDGAEICRLTFNPQNFVENFYKSLPFPSPETLMAEIQSIKEQGGIEPIGEETNPNFKAALEKATLMVMLEMKTKHIAEMISENLAYLLLNIMEDAIRAYAFNGSIELNKQTGKAISSSRFKEVYLKQQWSRIVTMAGIKQGGARERKGFVWSEEKKAAFYDKVEALPKHKSKSIWQFLLDELIEQEFDAETVTWLRSNPAIKNVPKELLNEAIKTWRKYLEGEDWDKMKPEDKPRAFEFRHALHLLEYPNEFKYSTLDTYYYEGKKLSDNQTKL